MRNSLVQEHFAVITMCLMMLPSCSMRHARFAAQAPQTAPTLEWEQVTRLPAGERIRVKQKSGKTVAGRLSAASDGSVAIGDHRIPKDDIQQVERIQGDSPLDGLAIGAGIGFTSGFAGEGLIYHAAGRATGFPDTYSWAAGLVGAIVGAVAGLVIDVSRKKYVTIYQAR